MSRYKKAWETLDSDAIIEIFTEDATYQVTPFKDPYVGHTEIQKYWREVVTTKEKDVEVSLDNFYVFGDTGMVEWSTKFTRNDNGNVEYLKGIILVEIRERKIQKLWEYWHKNEIKT